MASSTQEARPLDAVMRRLFRPLLRLALRQGFAFRELCALLKREYILIAEAELRTQKLPTNTSRVSAMTGINRNDILECNRSPDELPPLALNVVSRILGQWERDRRFQDSRGRPRPLTCTGTKNEFEKLVASVSAHLGYSTVLAELERSGAVERRNDMVRIKEVVAWGSSDIQKGLDLLARNVDTMCGAVEENLHAGKQRNLHLRTTYDNVLLKSMEPLRREIREEGKVFHEKMREIISPHDRDITTSDTDAEGGAQVVVITVAHIVKPEPKAP
ncbi:MAG: DUF6502 family protein [Bdellovibrionota bacterium]|nr:MAG: DUF6502 family protein [Bdellovibrionota bacterium]